MLLPMKLVAFLFLSPLLLVQSLDPAFNDDVLGLIVFKAGLVDPQSRLTSWNEEDNVACKWVGVKCDPTTNRVTELVLNGFSLSGHIGRSLVRLQSLTLVQLSRNNFSGTISPTLAQIPSLEVLDLSDNSLSGLIPEELFQQCGRLKAISLAKNCLTGPLPQSLSSCSNLHRLNLSLNRLSGEFPGWIGEMRSLEFLYISGNNFSGRVPSAIGNLQSLKQLNMSRNRFLGSLPESFGGCVNLNVVDFGHNSLSGNLPSWLFVLALESVSLSVNRYSGSITFPASWLQSFQSLKVLDLSFNALTGVIPAAIGNFSRLQALNLSHNSLVGSIQASIGELNMTCVLDVSHNRLSGSIPPEVGRVVSLQQLRLDSNMLSGAIPTEIGNCSFLTSLVLSQNNLTGPVPGSVTNLSNLEVLDLSFNNLSGSLPKELTNLSHLVWFNISFNNIEGELPVGGFFNTIPSSSVIGNPSLCGSIVKQSCPAVHPKPLVLNPNSSVSNHGPVPPNLRHKRIVLSISSLVAIGAAVFIALGVVTVSILNMHTRTSMSQSAAAFTFSGGDDFSPSQDTEANYGKLVMFSGEADFAAGAQSLLNKNCELGRGGFGAVYKTELRGGRSVAIKKLNTTSLAKCQEDFEREVKTLGKIRHQNLVTLEGYYWTPSLQLLINEYISAGSLNKHLQDRGDDSCLTWQQRFNIILGTAKGLAHLHRMNVIHYNMKSSNVLIDVSGDPKVGDFALARLLPAFDRYILSSKVQSAFGYMAPEFACQTVKITEKCDVHGFGVLTLEVLTGKRPVEYMEDDVVVLSDMVREALDEGRIEECIDKKLKGGYPVEEAIPIVKLGLICASQVPSNRPDMEEVIRILELIQTSSEKEEMES
ncbi:putative LRR receptor-like serine/threonine-protein kinase IRK [Salvia divinorum]|uniref:LRR receptor-like serine/threonine-protein kinase IRK n=1 Tax=Salvia divinorum TaxID=28513 RepID=A0ABD1GZ78_SALDI